MKNIDKRILIFLGACIPARIMLALLAKNISTKYLQYLGYITLIISFSFLYLYTTNKRLIGTETFGSPIWWAKFRIIHGLLYLLFSIYAIKQNTNAYLFLFIDTFIGLLLFINNHYNYLFNK